MDAPLAAVVHIGGRKATVTTKPNKMKTAKRVGLYWSAEDKANLFKKRLMESMMTFGSGLPVSELEELLTSEEEGYETDESNFEISVPGRLSSVYTPEELDDHIGGLVRIWLEDCPLPELKLDDDYEEFSISSDDRNDGNKSESPIS